MGLVFNDEPIHLGYRDLDYILAGKSTNTYPDLCFLVVGLQLKT